MVERIHRQQAQDEVGQRNHEIGLLKHADSMKNQFFTNVAHELHTRMTVLMLTSDNLDLLYDHIDDQQRKKLIGQICKQTAMLNELVKKGTTHTGDWRRAARAGSFGERIGLAASFVTIITLSPSNRLLNSDLELLAGRAPYCHARSRPTDHDHTTYPLSPEHCWKSCGSGGSEL